jgi:hypothetical protein
MKQTRRDPKRIPYLLRLLEQVWTLDPDMRLGQLIENAKAASGAPDASTFYVEDSHIWDGLYEMLQGQQERAKLGP